MTAKYTIEVVEPEVPAEVPAAEIAGELKNAKLVEYAADNMGVLEGIEYPAGTDSMRVWYLDGTSIKKAWVGAHFSRAGMPAKQEWAVVGVEFFDAAVGIIRSIGQCELPKRETQNDGSNILDLFDRLTAAAEMTLSSRNVTPENLFAAFKAQGYKITKDSYIYWILDDEETGKGHWNIIEKTDQL